MTDRSSDPFELLGLPRSFQIRREELDHAHLQASMLWHPDRFVLRPEHERLTAEDKMASINDAYSCLKDPLARALALLKSEGFSMTEGTDTTSSPDFLMAMMELKEEAANAVGSKSNQEVEVIMANLSSLEKQEVAATEGQFELAASQPQNRQQLFEAARGHLQKAAYYRKTGEDLNRHFH